MTTFAKPEQSTQLLGAATQYRTPRVNLLPPEIKAAERLQRTKIVLGAGLVLVVAAVGGVYALQVQDKHAAERSLAAEQARGQQLQVEQAKYSDVPQTLAAIDAAEQSRRQAMAKDVAWSSTLSNLQLTLPTNVWFTGATLHLDDTAAAPTGAQTGTATTVDTATVGAIGQVTVQGVARTHDDVATWLDVLGRQPGFRNAYFSSSTAAKIGTKDVVNYASTAELDEDALTHRFDQEQDR